MEQRPNVKDFSKEHHFISNRKAVSRQKADVITLLDELQASYKLENNALEIRANQGTVYGELLPSGHLFLYKFSEKTLTYTHAHTCESIQAITTYFRAHVL